MMKIFVIGDCHFPFHNKKALNKIFRDIQAEKPDVIIQVGDLLDQYVFSKFSKSAGVTVESDIKAGIQCSIKFWQQIQKLAPKAKCYQILGNHDLRLAKRISEKLPELNEIYDPLIIYQFKGVKTLKSDRDYLVLDGIVFCHGWLGKSIDHAKHFNRPCVHGHLHKPTIVTEGKLWSMDVGFIGDETSLPMSYTQSKLTKWRMAYGIIENKQPRLVFL